ncbi:hypothetical protein KKG22_00535 [Patescibacteria group bacterium]|nr:hypothetical protein [Patescibacteria group bacterium]
MNIKKYLLWLTLFIIVTSFAVIAPFIVNAQSQNQTASLTILPGNIFILQTPSDFFFNPVFINTSSTSEIYKTLAPATSTSWLVVQDSDTAGHDFNVTLAITNLVSNTSVIPFSNIAFVTLSLDSGGVDAYSPEANMTNLTAPFACTSWSGNLELNCGSDLNLNFLSESPQFFTADPMQPANNTTTNIYVDSYDSDPDPINVIWAVNYGINDIIEFSDGEKALVTGTTPGPVGSAYITVIRGVLNTTPATHAIGSGITSHGNTSVQEVIMDGPEPVDYRIGAYSFGFGFKSLIEPIFLPGDYTGTITFTLYIS